MSLGYTLFSRSPCIKTGAREEHALTIRDFLALRPSLWSSLLPFFLQWGFPPPFQKLTFLCAGMLGTQTLLSMRQFIEDADKEKGSPAAELEEKGLIRS